MIDGTRINFWGRETGKSAPAMPWSWWSACMPVLARKTTRKFLRRPTRQSGKRRATKRREREKLALRGRALPLFAGAGVDPVRTVLGMSLTELRGVLSREATWDEQVLGRSEPAVLEVQTRSGVAMAQLEVPRENLESTLVLRGCGPVMSGLGEAELRQLDEATSGNLAEANEVCRRVRDGELTINEARARLGMVPVEGGDAYLAVPAEVV